MTTSDYRNFAIATACWRAAKSDLHQVMLSVLLVFKNRATAGYFEGDLYTVAVNYLVENPGDFPDPRDPEFQQLLNKLDGVISGQVQDKTGGALWFYPKHELDTEKLASGYSITTTIGSLIFIK